MKNTLALFLAMSVSTGLAQADTNFESLHRDAEIMKNILNTSLKQERKRRGIRYQNLEATYLANQGLVFEVHTSGGRKGFSFNLGNLHFPDVAVPPQAPNIVFSSDDDFAFEVYEEGDLQVITQEALETAREALSELRERSVELREREREIAWEQREVEREMRDVEFEMRRADGEDRAELEQRKTDIRQRLDELRHRRGEVKQYASELEKEQKEKQAEQGKARREAYQSFLASFEDTIADTLCRYGASVRSMPKDEHVTFVLKGFGHAERRNDKRDKIYVFSNSNISDCVAEKMDKEDLLKKVQTYHF